MTAPNSEGKSPDTKVETFKKGRKKLGAITGNYLQLLAITCNKDFLASRDSLPWRERRARGTARLLFLKK
jgi:hypothetical protein